MNFSQGKKFIILFVLIIILSVPVSAQELTLNDCIQLALKNRASIISARGLEDLAKANKRSALGAFLPNISASYRYNKGKETDIDPATQRATAYDSIITTSIINNDTAKDLYVFPSAFNIVDEQDVGPSKSLNVSGSISVFNLGNWFNLFEAKANKEAARLDVINSEQNLIYSVKLSYYAYLASVQNVDVQKQAVARSEEQLKLIQSRYDLGSASLSDVLKQKVQYGNDKLTFLKAKNAVVTTNASLAYTIGIDPNSEVEFSKDYISREFQGTVLDATKFGLEHEPGLLSATKELEASKHNVRSNYSSYIPTISAFYNFNKFTGTQAFPIVFDYSSITKTYGFSISWNIFDGFFRERQLTSAKVRRNNAFANLADTKNLVSRDIKTAYFEIEQQKEAKKVAGENVEAANEDLKITQEKYNLGAATILDLLDAQVSLKQAQVSLIQADFDLNLTIAKLENAMGKI
ncbi:MAG: TolC family protein [Candidatus Zixiibacteriota bacterium]